MDARFMAIFIAFICVFAANNSEGGRKLEETVSDNGVQVIDKHTAAQAWNYCQKELKDSAETVKGLDSALSHSITACDGVELGIAFSAKRIIQKAIDDLPPNEKEVILHCLKKKNFPLQVFKDDHWTLWAGIPRRYLRRLGGYRGILSTDSSAYASTPSPVSTSPDDPPSDTDYDLLPSNSDYSPPANDVHHPPDEISPIASQNDTKQQQYLVIAVVCTLLGALGIVTVALLVWLKRDKRVEPQDEQRDEKPLLNFSTSDVSAGSSEKSHVMGTPINMHSKTPPSTAGGNPSDANCVSSGAGFQSTQAQADALGKTALPLPPGRTAPPAAVEGVGPVEAGADAGVAALEPAELTGAVAPPPPPPPKPPAPAAPPPPPRAGRRPPPPNPPIPARPSPLGPHRQRSSAGETSECSDESEAPKTKLKPFFWDKVLASPDHSMVWHEIKSGSFQFNEEMMEALFGYAAADQKKQDNRKGASSESPSQFIQIIDPKKAQNLAILLKALNVTTEEVRDALREGNELPPEFIQTLLKMAPTTDEELKLRLYGGDLSQLGPAERFLKVVVDIPFAFKRLESVLFMSTFQEELTSIKDSLATLEVACNELRNSRLFLKLLEAVLKTGNRMNDGTYRGGAQAFKLDTLLKLSDVKGTDGKTTLLHFVVHEIIRGEGVRAARKLKENRSLSSVKTEDLYEDSSHESEEYHRSLGLQVVSGLSNELLNVKKAALIDNETLSESASKLGQARVRTKDFLENELDSEEENEFRDVLQSFITQCESDITSLIEEEKRVMALVKSTGDYFHGRAGRDEGAHLFVIVRDFLVMVDKACLDVKSSVKLPARTQRKDVSASSSPSPSGTPLVIHQRLFPAMRERQMDDDDDDFSSGDES